MLTLRALAPSLVLVSLCVPSLAFANGALTVAADPPAAAPPSSAAATPRSDTFSAPDAVEAERKGVSLSGAFYLFSGAAVDDFAQGGFIVRPELELYAAFGLGDVSLFLGGTVLGVEGTYFGKRSGMSIPVLATVGVRDDTWLVSAAGGVSVAEDNNYGEDIIDDEESMPSPRGELRVGYRFEGFGELMGIVGAEQRMFTNREDSTRLFFGLSIGIGADGNTK